MSTTTPTPVDLPSGIVTFVFTDIEGSTRLLDRLGGRFAEILDRHREILRSAWAEHGGHELSAGGDEFLVAFASADDAVRASLAGQRALAAEPWPDEAPLRVRIGVHAGLASPRDGSYVALAVHRAARVVAAANGGQILVSEDAVEALDSREGTALRSLGRYRLRDFDEPVELYEAGDPVEHDRPVRAVPADGHNLVRQPDATIGREEEIATLADAVTAGRVVTLTGPGGVGKTRVAAEVGLRIAPDWPDGVWLVDLAGVHEDGLVAAAIASDIGVPARPGRDRWDDVLDHLADRQAVVVLDNCEHVLAACAEHVDELLSVCRGVGVLATSREPMHLSREVTRVLAPLGVPVGDDPGPDEVLATPAGRLFAERGAAARAEFEVTADNAAAVAGICRRLDGLPLLLELAAAHLSARSAAEILSGLEDRFRLLRSPDPRVSDRHRTVEGLLGWSYDLLDVEEQAAFRRVAAFGGSFTMNAAVVAIDGGDGGGGDAGDGGDAAGHEVDDASRHVWSLVNRSLVSADLAANGTRYRLLETVRSYGRRLLEVHDETGEVAVALATWYLDRIGPWHPADRRWVSEVGVELDNLRALIPLLPPEREEIAQQIACTIGFGHDASQTFREGIRELTGYVDRLDAPTPTRVSLLTELAYLHLRTGEVGPAEELLAAADEVQDEHGAPEWDEIAIDRTRGEIARRAGDLDEAVTIARRALERPLSDHSRSRMYNLLGTSAAALGDLETAYDALTEELALNEAIGAEGYVASAHGNLAETALRLGDVPTAAHHQRACLERGGAQGSSAMVAFSLIVAARIAGSRGEWPTAGALHARGEALLDEIGLALYEDDRRQSDELLARVRAELGDDGAAEAEREGLELPLPEAMRRADAALAAAERDDDAAPTT